MQGGTSMSETLAQYSALMVMKHLYGPDKIRRFLKYELDNYLRSRAGEAVEEVPLERVENQGYIHYRKGTLAMYWLREALGEAPVDRAMRRLLQQYAFKAAPYPNTTDFLKLLREEAGPGHDELIADLLEKITLLDVKVTDASAVKRSDGRYEVALVEATVSVPSHDFRAALGEVDRLAGEIRAVKGFDAQVVESPLDVSTSLLLQGHHPEREAQGMEARFILRIVRKGLAT